MKKIYLMRLSGDTSRKVLAKPTGCRLKVIVLNLVCIHILLFRPEHIICIELKNLHFRYLGT